MNSVNEILRQKGYLVLADGTVYEGILFGSQRPCVGELVFATGMSGYTETLTDPSYYGQIVLQTFPLIGNYGINPADFEGQCALHGYVVRELCDEPSNFRSLSTVDAFLKRAGVPGIYGVDTRSITRRIREYGVINAGIFPFVPDDLSLVKHYKVHNAVESVSCSEILRLPSLTENASHHIVLIDFGAKGNIVRCLQNRGCDVTIVPYETSARDIIAMAPDGVMLSNGPGDPADNKYVIEQLRSLIGEIPVFGICLGHQLAALAMGGRTYKMKYGHRGANQPVKDLVCGRTFITTQNHGYAVDNDSLSGIGDVIFVNANDGTCEGVEYKGKGCFTVQFHPEACAGPKDTEFLFDRFISML